MRATVAPSTPCSLMIFSVASSISRRRSGPLFRTCLLMYFGISLDSIQQGLYFSKHLLQKCRLLFSNRETPGLPEMDSFEKLQRAIALEPTPEIPVYPHIVTFAGRC